VISEVHSFEGQLKIPVHLH